MYMTLLSSSVFIKNLKNSSCHPCLILSMGEIIQIHVGQAGVQIANACWELYCLEHGINADGTLCDCPCDMNFENFFAFKDTNKVVPRTVLVDSEPTVIDQVRTGPYGHLYSPGSLITGKEDSGSNFARGYYTMGAELIDITMEAIRVVAESCCNLKGFILFRSTGGGTGSGLGNLIAEQVHEEYEKIAKMEFIIFPSPCMSPLIVEPYNALLATHLGMDSIDCTFILDNEALYDICSSKLNIVAPKYKNLNRIIGQTASTFTTSQRFAGSSNVSFVEFETNLVPYPRIHFPVVSYSPFIPGTGSGYTNFSTEQITNACFEPCSQLIRCNPSEGKYMTCVLLYRGRVTTSDINGSIAQLRATKTVRFVDWSPTGFKVGMNAEPPFAVPCGGLGNSDKALVALSNNTIIQKAWSRLIGKHERLYSRRAFIHHYIQEGMEEDAFKEAAEDICALISDYMEVDKAATTDDIPVNIKSCGDKEVRVSHHRLESASRHSTLSKPDRDICESRHSHHTVILAQHSHGSKMADFEDSDAEVYVSDDEYSHPSKHQSMQKLPGVQSLNYFFGACSCTDMQTNEEGTSPEGPTTWKCVGHLVSTECPVHGTAANAPPKSPLVKKVSDSEPSTSNKFQHLSLPTRSEDTVQLELSQDLCHSVSAPILKQHSIESPPQPSHSEPKSSLKLPTRSAEMLEEDSKPVRKSKSYEHVSTDKLSQHSLRRSKSHEPKRTECAALQSAHNVRSWQNFDCGIDTEATRAKKRFVQSSCWCGSGCRPACCASRCCPGEVLRLPSPRPEGREFLGEALSAKERFCNSTCQRESCIERPRVCCKSLMVQPTCTCEMPINPCDNQQPSCSCQFQCNCPQDQGAKCARMMWVTQPLKCGPKARRPPCFCCHDTDNFNYSNSDDQLVPMCCSLPRKKCCYPLNNSRDREIDRDNCGPFNVSSTVLVPPRCPAYNICYPDDEVICCPSDDRGCEYYPQCNMRPTMCPTTICSQCMSAPCCCNR